MEWRRSEILAVAMHNCTQCGCGLLLGNTGDSKPDECVPPARCRICRESRGDRERLTQAFAHFVGSPTQALDAWARIAGHSRRVSAYSCAIAKIMKLAQQDLETIRIGALLHDVGKLTISKLVLQKPGRLTFKENKLVRQHPITGRRVIEMVPGLESYLGIVELHHENLDGSGYPYGLKGEEIPLHARIVKVADAYDAMTSYRPYRRERSHAEAFAILKSVCGSEMDSVVVEAFAKLGNQLGQWAIVNGTQPPRGLSQAVRSETSGFFPKETPLLADKATDTKQILAVR
jgi:HD-GYP domain-containing protein (c-di-GMP phosphodiesterase class II)